MDVQDTRRFYHHGPPPSRLGNLADSMLAARTLGELDAALRRLRDAFGLSYCRYEARFPGQGRSREMLLVAGAPADEWRFAEAMDEALDRVREHCRQSICPLLWPDADLASGAAGMLNVAIPLASRSGDFALLQGCWAHDPPMGEAQAREQLPELSWTALHLHQSVRLLMLKEAGAPGERLTAREIECLQWIAQGKTSWEVAQILEVTEHTVIFHANNAMRKLGVNARAAAVQRAMSLGYL